MSVCKAFNISTKRKKKNKTRKIFSNKNRFLDFVVQPASLLRGSGPSIKLNAVLAVGNIYF